MHHVEDIFTLAVDDAAYLLAYLCQLVGGFLNGLWRNAHIHHHHHVEITAGYGLGYIQDVYLVIGKIGTYLRYDAYRIFSYYSHNGLFHFFLLYIEIFFSNACFLEIYHL